MTPKQRLSQGTPQSGSSTPKTLTPKSKSSMPKTLTPQSKSSTPKTLTPQSKSSMPKTLTPQSKSSTPKTLTPQSKSSTPKTLTPQSKSSTPKTPPSDTRRTSPRLSRSNIPTPKTPPSDRAVGTVNTKGPKRSVSFTQGDPVARPRKVRVDDDDDDDFCPSSRKQVEQPEETYDSQEDTEEVEWRPEPPMSPPEFLAMNPKVFVERIHVDAVLAKRTYFTDSEKLVTQLLMHNIKIYFNDRRADGTLTMNHAKHLVNKGPKYVTQYISRIALDKLSMTHTALADIHVTRPMTRQGLMDYFSAIGHLCTAANKAWYTMNKVKPTTPQELAIAREKYFAIRHIHHILKTTDYIDCVTLDPDEFPGKTPQADTEYQRLKAIVISHPSGLIPTQVPDHPPSALSDPSTDTPRTKSHRAGEAAESTTPVPSNLFKTPEPRTKSHRAGEAAESTTPVPSNLFKVSVKSGSETSTFEFNVRWVSKHLFRIISDSGTSCLHSQPTKRTRVETVTSKSQEDEEPRALSPIITAGLQNTYTLTPATKIYEGYHGRGTHIPASPYKTMSPPPKSLPMAQLFETSTFCEFQDKRDASLATRLYNYRTKSLKVWCVEAFKPGSTMPWIQERYLPREDLDDLPYETPAVHGLSGPSFHNWILRAIEVDGLEKCFVRKARFQTSDDVQFIAKAFFIFRLHKTLNQILMLLNGCDPQQNEKAFSRRLTMNNLRVISPITNSVYHSLLRHDKARYIETTEPMGFSIEALLSVPDYHDALLEELWENGVSGDNNEKKPLLFGDNNMWSEIQVRNMNTFKPAYRSLPSLIKQHMDMCYSVFLTGLGKTDLAMALFPNYYFCDNLGGLKHYNSRIHKGIILGEVTPDKADIPTFIVLSEPNKPGTVRIRFGTVLIPQFTPRVLISNYSMDSLLKRYTEMVCAGRRREAVCDSELAQVTAATMRVITWEINEFVGVNTDTNKGTRDIRLRMNDEGN
ncbi:unnamed protein product [Allacma fusca]|uniref:Uncharacterized protein n=1 Tax=Allacma fusca TaxID=39272 RepID=A0A8J2LY68_9HEXA|nr:unnamed protein product [Allacma fusca]